MTDLQSAINDWFHRHFSHVAPGTPEHSRLLAAKEDLVTSLSSVSNNPLYQPSNNTSSNS